MRPVSRQTVLAAVWNLAKVLPDTLAMTALRKRRLLVSFGFFFASLIVLGTSQAAAARERGPRVEVVCPSPPIPVTLAQQQILVYELHVTNFDVVPLTLERIEVFSDANTSQPLTTISADALAATMLLAGSQGGAKDAQTIPPANRAVIFMWIALGPDTQTPTTLRHRMSLWL